MGSSVMGFFRQEHWSGLPFPFAGDLPDPRIEPTSPVVSPALLGVFFISEPPRKPCSYDWLDRKEEDMYVCVCVCVCVMGQGCWCVTGWPKTTVISASDMNDKQISVIQSWEGAGKVFSWE